MSRHLIALTAMSAALAACSSPAPPETSAAVISGPADVLVASALDQPSAADGSVLDGAPVVVAPQAPAPVQPKAAPRIQHASASLDCDIDVTRTAHGVRITPVVKSGRDLSGEYSFVITKDDAAGSSDISQGGPFEAGRGERTPLGSSELSLGRGGSFRAVLKVRAGGREVCREIRS